MNKQIIKSYGEKGMELVRVERRRLIPAMQDDVNIEVVLFHVVARYLSTEERESEEERDPFAKKHVSLFCFCRRMFLWINKVCQR